MIEQIIKLSVDFLMSEQYSDGSFPTLTSSDPDTFTEAVMCASVFASALILSNLREFEEKSDIENIKKKLSGFLLLQKSANWSFNYWKRDSEQYKNTPYPDDLDDTFCALSSLYQYKPDLIDGATMAKIVTLLTSLEIKEGGPYRTWLVSNKVEDVWLDIDLAVNNNIAHFLSLQEIELPNLILLTEKAIEERSYYSPYYPSEYPIIYFISRWYRGNKKEEIIQYLLKCCNQDGNWDNPLNTALAISSLLNLGYFSERLKNNVDYLLEKQKNGRWNAYGFCFDPEIKGVPYYAGSSSLTTSFCLEALQKYSNQKLKKKNQGERAEKERIKQEEQVKIYNAVIDKIKEKIKLLPEDLKQKALEIGARIIKNDKDNQVILLPYYFKESLGVNGKKVSDDFIVLLGAANVYGWVAYSVYDDFLDDEGDQSLLSVANFCLRELTIIFNNILDGNFSSFFQKVMNQLDTANIWEILNCRISEGNIAIPDYGDYSIFAERALGHALGPIAILFSLGYREDSFEVKNILDFFYHFIIARQFNDDAHDWEEDLEKGQINGVGALVLRQSQIKISKSEIEKNKVVLQNIFWYNVIGDICNKVILHINKASELLKSNRLIVDSRSLEKIIAPLKKNAEKTLQEQKEAIKFLKAYR